MTNTMDGTILVAALIIAVAIFAHALLTQPKR